MTILQSSLRYSMRERDRERDREILLETEYFIYFNDFILLCCSRSYFYLVIYQFPFLSRSKETSRSAVWFTCLEIGEAGLTIFNVSTKLTSCLPRLKLVGLSDGLSADATATGASVTHFLVTAGIPTFVDVSVFLCCSRSTAEATGRIAAVSSWSAFSIRSWGNESQCSQAQNVKCVPVSHHVLHEFCNATFYVNRRIIWSSVSQTREYRKRMNFERKIDRLPRYLDVAY